MKYTRTSILKETRILAWSLEVLTLLASVSLILQHLSYMHMLDLLCFGWPETLSHLALASDSFVALPWRSPSSGMHFSFTNQLIQNPHLNHIPYLAFTLWAFIHLLYYPRARSKTTGTASKAQSPLKSSNYPILNLLILPHHFFPCVETTIKTVALNYSLFSFPGAWPQCFLYGSSWHSVTPSFGEL